MNVRYRELLALAFEQIELGRQLAEARLLETRIDLMQADSMHMRDRHQGHYNVDAALKQNADLRKETAKIREKYDANNRRIDQLKAELAEMAI